MLLDLDLDLDHAICHLAALPIAQLVHEHLLPPFILSFSLDLYRGENVFDEFLALFFSGSHFCSSASRKKMASFFMIQSTVGKPFMFIGFITEKNSLGITKCPTDESKSSTSPIPPQLVLLHQFL